MSDYNSVYDMLEIDETEGIDPGEIAAIKATIARVKVAAATFVKGNNDTTNVLQILRELERIVRRASVVRSVDELHEQLAQNAAGQPAAALGTGRPPGSTPTDAHTGLRAILSDPGVDPGIQRALVRLLTPADPEYLPVDRQGTPVDMIAASRERDAARAERNTAKAERDAAQQELANERSVTHNGSLAKQLATAIAERDTARAAAGGYDQNAARAAAQAVLAAINAQRGKLGGTVEGKDVVIAKLGELAQTIGLRAAPPATP